MRLSESKVFKFNSEYLFRISLVLSVVLVYGLISLFLGQDTHGDVWNYHLYNGWSYLNDRLLWDYAPAGAHSFFNPYLDVVFFVLSSSLSGEVYAFVIGAVHGTMIIPIYLIISEFVESRSEKYLLSLICAFSSVVSIGCIGLSTHDNFEAILILWAFWFCIRYIKTQISMNLAVVGVLLGIAAGLKLTSAAYIVAIGIMVFIFSPFKIKTKFYDCSIFCFFCAVGLFISSGFWFFNLYKEFGNPVFPFYNNIFQSPYALIDGSATTANEFFQQIGLEHLFYPLYFADHPERVLSAGNPQDFIIYYPSAMLIVGLMALVLKFGMNDQSQKGRFLLIIISSYFVSFFTWQIFFGVYRYFIPTDLLLPFFVFYSIKYILTFRIGKIAKYVALLPVIIISIYQVQYGIPTWGRSSNFTEEYYVTNAPKELKESNAIFLATYPLAWILPVIEPKGHAITIAEKFLDFESEVYKQRFLNLGITEKQYLVAPKSQISDLHEIERNLNKYNRRVNWKNKREFYVKLSSYKIDFYCFEVNNVK